MDIALNSPEPMDNAKKWLSVGAGAAGLILSLCFICAGIGFGKNLFAVLMTIFILALSVWGALAGVGFICKKGPRFLNRLPAPMLIVLGLILGGLVVAVGAICLILRGLAEIGSAL